jgi:hypothetical protein
MGRALQPLCLTVVYWCMVSLAGHGDVAPSVVHALQVRAIAIAAGRRSHRGKVCVITGALRL